MSALYYQQGGIILIQSRHFSEAWVFRKTFKHNAAYFGMFCKHLTCMEHYTDSKQILQIVHGVSVLQETELST